MLVIMVSLNTRLKTYWRLLFAGLLTSVSMIMLYVVFQNQPNINYRRLDFGDDETPEDVCDCQKILQGDRDEIDCSKILTVTKDFKKTTQINDNQYVEMTKDCEMYRRTRKYVPFPLSEEEEEFPIAYSIVVHHKVQNFERLLRSIYTPQNLYCIHVDKKTPTSTLTAISSIVSCFNNVFLVSQREQVFYASWGRVQADINCMKDLYQVSHSWKYFINLCGQDFPIKTNLEIVRALKALAGANSLETESMPSNKVYRWKKKYHVVNNKIQQINQDKNPPPSNIKIFSGNAYIVVSRAFVRFVLEDPVAQTLIAWSNDTYSPDELLWATMQRIPGVPGFFPAHSKFDVTDMYSISRLIKWAVHEGGVDKVYPACQGIHVREVCVYGSGDLQWMLQQHHLFANKFDTDYDPIAIRCLEKYLRHKALKKLYEVRELYSELSCERAVGTY